MSRGIENYPEWHALCYCKNNAKSIVPRGTKNNFVLVIDK